MSGEIETRFQLIGKHVRLIPLELEQCDSLCATAREDRSTFGLTPVPSSFEEMRDYVASACKLRSELKAVPFAIIAQSSGGVAGSTRFCNLEYWQWSNGHPLQRVGVPDALEIGWTWLAPRFQRTAINTEMKLLMLSHAFEVWKVHRVTLKTDARNDRSRKAIERLGAKFDGILRSHMPAYDDGIRDSAYYSIVAREWSNVKRDLQQKLGFEYRE